MAVNIEGWSANDEPEPEEEEVSIFVSDGVSSRKNNRNYGTEIKNP